MDRAKFISKAEVITALEHGNRVYYVEKGSTEIYEFSENEAVELLRNAEFLIEIKKG